MDEHVEFLLKEIDKRKQQLESAINDNSELVNLFANDLKVAATLLSGHLDRIKENN